MVPEVLPAGQAVPIAVGTPDTGCVCRLVGSRSETMALRCGGRYCSLCGRRRMSHWSNP